MNPFLLFRLFLEALDSNEFHCEINNAYDDLQIFIILHCLNKKRSIIYKQPKSYHWYETILFNYDDTRFRKTLRMSQSTFCKIVYKICNHQNFKNQRILIEKQLAVVLYRLGGKSTIWDISSKFGIAEGTVILFTSRIISVLKSLKSQVIIWPCDTYHQEVHNGFEEKQGFSNVIGALDGTHINLLEAPCKINKDVYFTRKRRYAIHLQAVVDHRGLFTFYDIGYPASVHDAKVFRNSKLYLCKDQLFEEQDYLLADSAYPISTTVIPTFKNPLRNRQRRFNRKHSKSRIVIEQAFGRLKNRFQLLKELRTKKTETATDIIEVSLILHNLVERFNDIWESSEGTSIHQNNQIQYNVNYNSRHTRAIKELGEIKRQNLMDIVL